MLKTRHHAPRARTETRRVNRHAAPTEHAEAFFVERAGDRRFGFVSIVGVGWQERETNGVGPARRQRHARNFAHELVWHLQQDARAIARVGLGASGTTVLHAAQRAKTGLHDSVAGDTFYLHHERHAA